jgi:hypothetical protein
MIFAKPKVDSEITVTIRIPTISYWTVGTGYEEFTYTGTVIADNKWTQPTEFVLLTPLTPNYPKRTVQLKWITSLNYANGTEAILTKEDNTTYQWTVDGSKGNKYIVIKAGNKFTCDCTGFTYRKTCKHIQQTIDNLVE